jgi:[acyl-carrier-protein] S-malonyltransferase
MTAKIAFLFPGQGSQYVNMGKEMAEAFAEAREVFETVDTLCRKPIRKLCFEGPLEELTLTSHLQPAVTAVNLACLAGLKKWGVQPALVAGHSLGEYSALAAAGVLSYADTLKLVDKRGELMHRESLKKPGSMVAIMGLKIDQVSELVRQVTAPGVVAVANHNTAEQIVITGEKEPVAKAAELSEKFGGKAIPLKVSGAWHCDLMQGAVEEFSRFMQAITFRNPQTDLIFNVTADKETDPQKIRDIMARQLVSPVRWYDSIQRMANAGMDYYVEVGPKTVLSNLLRKILPKEKLGNVYNVEDMKTLEKFLAVALK